MSFLIWFLQALAIFYMLLFVHGIISRVLGYLGR